MWTYILVYLYHNRIFCYKFRIIILFYKTDFIYLRIEIIEQKLNRMTLQQMEYIVAVNKYRHFARAAESCGVSQSTLSSLVQKLEIELDITIFDRNSHPVKPTAVGAEIISRAKQLLFNAAQVRELVATRKGESVGKVSLGITSTVAPYLLPKMFKYLSVHHPDIELHVEEARVSTIISQLERGELDIALLATPLNNVELLEIPVYQERLMAYVSPEEPIYNDMNLQTDRLPVGSIWVLREGYCPNRGVFPFCDHRASRQAVYEAGSVETLIKIVDENGGYAIIPELHVPLLRKCQQANVRGLTNPEPSREIAFVVHRNFVRERLLNILADAIRTIIPPAMVNKRLEKFSITL
ncbi:LysR substrate-binding domain-containing protein [Coprobacter secundus]|nr:LysR substrate-binding domain-containing protein [Coprobacter secundus]